MNFDPGISQDAITDIMNADIERGVEARRENSETEEQLHASLIAAITNKPTTDQLYESLVNINDELLFELHAKFKAGEPLGDVLRRTLLNMATYEITGDFP